MTRSTQHRGWTAGMRQGVASAAPTLVLVLVAIATQTARSQVLYTFTGGADGGNSYAGLVQDAAGNLYGTAICCGAYDGGTLFQVDTSGIYTVLHNFGFGSDAAGPAGDLVQDAAGNLYGTTAGGGGFGYGAVFKLDTSGTESVLYSFAGGTADGCYPYGGVVRDAEGNLYGTTYECGTSNVGTVFKVDTSGTETVLHSFNGPDGAYPYLTSLLMDKKGNLYGVTWMGGPSNTGVVYVLTKSGKLTVLHGFRAGQMDGGFPSGTPAMDKKGNVYGTTRGFGSHSHGIVWKVSQNGKETVLRSFWWLDGTDPQAGVIIDADGNLYGTTQWGGGNNAYGTVYELDKAGRLTVLATFAGFAGAGGNLPYGGLVRDAKGNLYGTALTGGTYSPNCYDQGNESGCGTVWKVTKRLDGD